MSIVLTSCSSEKSDDTKPAKNSSTLKQQSRNDTSNTGFVEWAFNGETWQIPPDTAPECEDPLSIQSPVDVSKVSSILYPGQVRGGDFKPHGGFALDNLANNEVTVSAVRDAYLYQGARYEEKGEIQYMFDFMDSCGVMYRFDHLLTLTEEFDKYAQLLPEPKVDDSRTTKFTEHPLIKQGTAIATHIGFIQNNNSAFDFGFYDLRSANDASKTDVYRTDQSRIDDKQQSFYALCWLDTLPSTESQILKNLPARGSEGKTSDYCL